MKLEVINKQGGFGRKPQVKKGYYPAQLIKVEEFKDKEGKLKEGKYGNQLILTFKVYKPGDKDEPTKPLVFTDDSLDTPLETEVEIPKFVYHFYKDKKTGDKTSALTPNSAITRVFKALGWEFDDSKPFDPEDFVNKWAEINLDDYEVEVNDGENYTASTIKDINLYKGPEPTIVVKAPEEKSSAPALTAEELAAKFASGDLSGDEFAEEMKKLKK